MLLNRVEVSGFRNLEGSVRFGPGLNILYGDNAQGKTNWLEAVYVLGGARSFRTNQLRDCVRFNAERAILRGEVVRGSVSRELQVVFTEASKEFSINGKREPLTRFIGNLDVFVFSMEELEVIRGDPSQRRRFIDRGIVTITPSYLGTLAAYNQVLRQKNSLLSEAGKGGAPQRFIPEIESWNDQLAEYGRAIHEARQGYVDRLNRVLEESDHGRLVFASERVSARYRSSLEGKGDLNDYGQVFRERLALRMPAEIAAGHSLIGPHRDDLVITADGREVARYGSAGQQRSALLLLDLARVSIYTFAYEESPVLVIDDIDAELDRGRIEALLSELEGRTQTIVSTSRRAIAGRYQDRAWVHLVEAGCAHCANDEGKAAGRTTDDHKREQEPVAEAVSRPVPALGAESDLAVGDADQLNTIGDHR
jgi:DNA replication and repair protein RecF